MGEGAGIIFSLSLRIQEALLWPQACTLCQDHWSSVVNPQEVVQWQLKVTRAQLLNRMTVGFSFHPGILLRVNYYIKHQLRPSQAKKGQWSYPSIATLHSPPIPAYERISPHHIGYSLRWLTITHNVLCLRTFLRNILALLIDLGSHETHWLDHSLIPGHGSVSICCIPGTGNTGYRRSSSTGWMHA